ncbi:MAG TPA: alpha/beta fold hydrolase [Gemmatimonadaceae bacterium]
MPLPLPAAAAATALLAGTGALIRAYRAWRVDQQWRMGRRFGADGVQVGAEPFELRAATGKAVLLLHGAGDTPQSVRALGESLHAAGYTVRAPLLPGHGRSPRALARTHGREWLAHVRAELAALEAMHPWVGIVAQSMGGALAVQLAAERPALPALVLLAPYLSVPPVVGQAAAWAPLWSLTIPFLPSSADGSILDPAERERALGYGMVSARSVRGLVATARAGAAALPKVRAPTLVLQSRADNRITAAGAEAAFAELGAPDKRFVWLDEGGHVISVDRGRERVFALVAEWLAAHGGVTGGGARRGPARG